MRGAAGNRCPYRDRPASWPACRQEVHRGRLSAETSFTGTIEKSEAGTGSISGDRVGDSLKGNADLTGHRVDFRAVISCGRIDGELTFGIFFDKKFTGTQVA